MISVNIELAEFKQENKFFLTNRITEALFYHRIWLRIVRYNTSLKNAIVKLVYWTERQSSRTREERLPLEQEPLEESFDLKIQNTHQTLKRFGIQI